METHWMSLSGLITAILLIGFVLLESARKNPN